MSRLLPLILLALLAGCGQKGPLYLPSAPPGGAPLPAGKPAAPASGTDAGQADEATTTDKKSTPAAAPAATAE